MELNKIGNERLELGNRELNKKKTVLAGILVLASWTANNVALAWIHERVPRGPFVRPLPDLWFQLFPEIPSAISVAEAIMLFSFLSASATLLSSGQPWLMFRRVFLMAAICYASRAVCITVVQVPVPSRKTYCGPKLAERDLWTVIQRVFGTFYGLGMDLHRKRVLCGDLIMSGHTISLVLFYLVISHYSSSKRYSQLFSWAFWLLTIFAVVCILLARKHYVIDVILAYYITTRVFWVYHAILANPQGVISRRFWWSALLFYFEELTPVRSDETA